MQITENKVVAIDYKLTNESGELIDQSTESDPMYYLHGGGQIIPGLEEKLEGKSMGDHFEVTVDPEGRIWQPGPGIGPLDSTGNV